MTNLYHRIAPKSPPLFNSGHRSLPSRGCACLTVRLKEESKDGNNRKNSKGMRGWWVVVVQLQATKCSSMSADGEPHLSYLPYQDLTIPLSLPGRKEEEEEEKTRSLSHTIMD